MSKNYGAALKQFSDVSAYIETLDGWMTWLGEFRFNGCGAVVTWDLKATHTDENVLPFTIDYWHDVHGTRYWVITIEDARIECTSIEELYSELEDLA